MMARVFRNLTAHCTVRLPYLVVRTLNESKDAFLTRHNRSVATGDSHKRAGSGLCAGRRALSARLPFAFRFRSASCVAVSAPVSLLRK